MHVLEPQLDPRHHVQSACIGKAHCLQGGAWDALPTCSNMSFGRSSCSSIVRMARLISSFESFSLGGGEGKSVNCSRAIERLEERVLSHPPTWPGDRDS